MNKRRRVRDSMRLLVIVDRLDWARGGMLLLLGAMLVGLASCANPVPPSGGPRDETPPSIVRTNPDRDTVNVSTDRRSVYIEFSEYVERSTLTRALSIRPRFDQRIRYDWSGRGVNIELPESLRDSTTYIFTFDTNLSDAHGVSLDEPITVAFSTGPRINRGQIRGRVVGPQQAQPRTRVDVFAYALSGVESPPPGPLPKRPAYRTQTGEDGAFAFNYLREQQYYVVALRDNNRNRRPDPSESYAVPPRVALAADTDSTEVPVPWLLTRADTTAPQFQRVQPLSRKRVRLSFTEPVRITSRDPDDWALRDSVTRSPVPVRAVYRPPERANAVVLRTAPMEPRRHLLPLSSTLVADTLGQGVVRDTARFQAVAQPDTMQTRFRTFVPERLTPDSMDTYSLLPGVQPGVAFNQPPDSSTLRSALRVRDTTGQSRSYAVVSENGRTYRLRLRPRLQPGEFVDVVVRGQRLAGADTTYRRRFRRVTDEVLGALEGRVVLADTTYEPRPRRKKSGSDTLAAADTAGGSALTVSSEASAEADSVVVELVPAQSSISLEPRHQVVAPGSTFVFQNLPEGTFRFRAFLDRDQNERWSGGWIRPYVPAEPLTWSQQPIDSRPRWTKVLPSSLRIPVLRRSSESEAGLSPDTTAADSLNGTQQ